MTNQQILRSMNVHDYVHKLLKLPYTARPEMAQQELGRRNIFLSCYRFLKNYVSRNPQNQVILLNHIEFYMSQMGAKLKAAETITEIFRDNRQVSLQIEQWSGIVTSSFVRFVPKSMKALSVNSVVSLPTREGWFTTLANYSMTYFVLFCL